MLLKGQARRTVRMTVHTPVSMSKDAFLAWLDGRDDRYEYAAGRIVMMVRVTKRHALVTLNLALALRTCLPAGGYDVVSDSFGVNVHNSYRVPDVLVEPVQTDRGAREAAAPVLIAEVLSPGTLHVDFGEKKAEYLSLPTLETYLVIAPDDPRVWIWQRGEDGFPSEPEIVEGDGARIALPSLGIELPLADLYRGVR
jgi:Uma2 family endonuclease